MDINGINNPTKINIASFLRIRIATKFPQIIITELKFKATI